MPGIEIKGLDPNFYFPEELIGVEYYIEDDREIIDDLGTGEEYDDTEDPEDGKLQPPPKVKIIKQVVRIVKGMEIVDVTFEFDDQERDLDEDNYFYKFAEPTEEDADAYTEVQDLDL